MDPTHHLQPKHLVAVPALQDNYIWLVSAKGTEIGRSSSPLPVVIVDPGDEEPVVTALSKHCCVPSAILVTHHHYDHVDGIAGLCQRYSIPIYGPAKHQHSAVTRTLVDQQTIDLPNQQRMQVFEVPGHTQEHIAYYNGEILFCGDTLFGGGCGRIFNGTAAQLFHSLLRLSSLPDDTLVCCAHEYTLANLEFALIVEPDNRDLQCRLAETERQRAQGLCTLPSTIGLEKKTNPFLRCGLPSVINAVEEFANRKIDGPEHIFSVLRYWKDIH